MENYPENRQQQGVDFSGISPSSEAYPYLNKQEENGETTVVLPASKKITKRKKQTRSEGTKRKGRSRRILWKPKEDTQLLEFLEVHGPKWTLIGKMIGKRTGKQVRDRYLNNLRPGINSNGVWTPEEDEKFKELYKSYGNKWAKIAGFLPGRTECQVKNRYYTVLSYVITGQPRKKRTNNSSTSDDSDLDHEDEFEDPEAFYRQEQEWRREQLRQEKLKREYLKREEAKKEQIKQIKQESVKREFVKYEEKTQCVKQEEFKYEHVKQEDVKREYIKQEDLKQEDLKQEEPVKLGPPEMDNFYPFQKNPFILPYLFPNFPIPKGYMPVTPSLKFN